jgi:uncharacterized membrane protein
MAEATKAVDRVKGRSWMLLLLSWLRAEMSSMLVGLLGSCYHHWPATKLLLCFLIVPVKNRSCITRRDTLRSRRRLGDNNYVNGKVGGGGR